VLKDCDMQGCTFSSVCVRRSSLQLKLPLKLKMAVRGCHLSLYQCRWYWYRWRLSLSHSEKSQNLPGFFQGKQKKTRKFWSV